MRSDFLVEKIFSGVNPDSLLDNYGKVTQVHGYFIEATNQNAKVGEITKVKNRGEDLECEVVSISNDTVLLAPLKMPSGIGVGDKVWYSGAQAKVKHLSEPFGRILNGLGEDISTKKLNESNEHIMLTTETPALSQRSSVDTIALTSIKVIDHLLPIGKGQKLGVFSGSGVGKSTLLNNMHHAMQADVKIIAMIGERSREVIEFYDNFINFNQSKDTFIVASTSDESPMMKHRALNVALSYAKAFCDQGKHVLLTVDSITRLAHALREVGISRGELPIVRGYPPSVFTELSKIVEMCGNFVNGGSITGLMSVLVDGDDEHEPVSDYMRGILDGHLFLERKLSDIGLYPSIDILKSRSRVSERIFSNESKIIAKQIKFAYSRYADIEDVVKTGIYTRGTNAEIDATIKIKSRLDKELYSSGRTLSKSLISDIKNYAKSYSD
ncbi:FliI/YscN family ATPase [Vibrio sp. Of14-4]|uniref:FliI/YscN family ATPase n=1 Tax=Vibrio sp. Of14-4 TaxID=2724878 RepID=UPI001EF37C9F|nr:FliI/YscN family ATPase [Vibrio sp. Of14-4]